MTRPLDDLSRFVAEDLGAGDLTTHGVARGERVSAHLLPREACVLAGSEEACDVFRRLGAKPEARFADGKLVHSGVTVIAVEGPAEAVLTGERLALNFLMRMSGIATATHYLVQRCRVLNPRIEVAATRKTTPGFRAWEKKAVGLGGGHPHRSGLHDAILIKDNHITVAGGVEQALRRVREKHPGKAIEIEAKTREQALAAARAGVESILLDNMAPDAVAGLAEELRKLHPGIFLEASGGITPDTAPRYARHVDRVSLGMLTHSVKAIDFTLDVVGVQRR